ncbi:flagellar biosynthesis sigma factor [Vibrio maritimus]|uniref:flagellar biosynthesis sigma factor n=1 Tax=Vibrio maritimus TaxID=990268 RepID=UPI0040694A8B
MMKVIATFLITITLCLSAFLLYQSKVITPETLTSWFSSSEAEPAPVTHVEVQVDNVLVPINLGNRQSLLLLDVSLYTPSSNKNYLSEQRSRIKNRIIKKFSVKEQSYFHNKEFIYVIQDDLKAELSDIASLQVGDVLVTKAVFQ